MKNLFFIITFLSTYMCCSCQKSNLDSTVPISSQTFYQKDPTQHTTMNIIYIHGWGRDEDPHKDIIQKIRSIYPTASISVKFWDANHLNFWEVKEVADRQGKILAEELASLPLHIREKTILIGHSLGGRVIIRALAQLYQYDLKIYQAILLAAAIPENDPDIIKALHATWGPNINVCNPKDFMLKYIYATFGEKNHNALGANGCSIKSPYYFQIIIPQDITESVNLSETNSLLNLNLIKKISNHHTIFYLEYLHQQLSMDFQLPQEILIPQDKTNFEMKVVNGKIWWIEEETYLKWQLQRHRITGLYRILDPDNYRRAWGDGSKMKQSFNKIKEQLKEKN